MYMLLDLHFSSLLTIIDFRHMLRDSRKSLGQSKADSRTAVVDEKDRALRRCIMLWKVLQKVYMPYLEAWRTSSPSTSSNTSDVDDLPAERIPIELPSNIPQNLRNSSSITDLATKELRLRHAQCYDSLASLRRELRIGAFLYDYKKVQVAGTGQRRNTRMLTFMQSHTAKKNRDADRYRHARNALCSLDPNGSWQSLLLPLRPSDEVAPFRGQEEQQKKRKRKSKQGAMEVSEGYRTLSWIWKTVAQKAGDSGTDPASAEDVEEGEITH